MRPLAAVPVVVALSLIGVPCPSRAASDENHAVDSQRRLTLDGRPLSTFATLPMPLPSRSASSPHRRRMSAGRLLQGAPVAQSFESLLTTLDAGYEVVVWNSAGRTRGRLLSMSGDEVVLSRHRLGLLRSPEDVIFAADSVTRVDIVDSTRNGVAIGATVGLGVVLGVGAWEARQPDGNQKGLLTFLALLGLPLSMQIGHAVDLFVNEPIFKRPPQTPRVIVTPLLDRQQRGVMLLVSF